MDLYFLDYNNYHNRVIKKEASISSYLRYQVGEVLQEVNFKPNNNVNTTQVVNSNEFGNYILCVENNEIVSRWFIVNEHRVRNGQYELELRRDLVVDYYDKLLNAPMFVEKATLGDGDPLIYNSENMSFNQIKTSETQLKDATNIPWIVGYYARSTGDSITTMTGTTTSDYPVDIVSGGTLEQWEYYEYTQTPFIGVASYINYTIKTRIGVSTDYLIYTLNQTATSINKESTTKGKNPGIYVYANSDSHPTATDIYNAFKDSMTLINNSLKNYYNYHTDNEVNELLNINGKTISFTDGSGGTKYYRATISSYTSVDTGNFNVGSSLEPYNTIDTCIKSTNKVYGDANEYAYGYTGETTKYKIKLTEISGATTTYSITADRYHLNDAPYDMFAIPYGDVTINNNGVKLVEAHKELGFSTVMSMIEQQGSKIYDVQLLPYCPVQAIIQADNSLDVKGDNKLYSLVKREDKTNVGIIFNVSTSSFTLDILLEQPIVITEKKLQALCDMYRLVSPNYNGQFEFNAAKNNGVSRFNVDCTYLPYKPYIHINPDFKNLYGDDFNDARGLICGGDFSLPIINDRWQEYQITNKNYQEIFDRQIQNMEFNNYYQNLSNVVSGIAGAGSGAVAGAVAGSMIAPGIGTAIGAVAGGGLSTIGAVADLAIQKSIQNEAIDYTKDQFGYSLGNIKALPDSITKTTAFTYNNKIFPILEYYTCTEVEKQALRDKIKWNGMTVMRIGTLADYIRAQESYIKGKLIRVDLDDANVTKELTEEMNKGVYI